MCTSTGAGWLADIVYSSLNWAVPLESSSQLQSRRRRRRVKVSLSRISDFYPHFNILISIPCRDAEFSNNITRAPCLCGDQRWDPSTLPPSNVQNLAEDDVNRGPWWWPLILPFYSFCSPSSHALSFIFHSHLHDFAFENFVICPHIHSLELLASR